MGKGALVGGSFLQSSARSDKRRKSMNKPVFIFGIQSWVIDKSGVNPRQPHSNLVKKELSINRALIPFPIPKGSLLPKASLRE